MQIKSEWCCRLLFSTIVLTILEYYHLALAFVLLAGALRRITEMRLSSVCNNWSLSQRVLATLFFERLRRRPVLVKKLYFYLALSLSLSLGFPLAVTYFRTIFGLELESWRHLSSPHRWAININAVSLHLQAPQKKTLLELRPHQYYELTVLGLDNSGSRLVKK